MWIVEKEWIFNKIVIATGKIKFRRFSLKNININGIVLIIKIANLIA